MRDKVNTFLAILTMAGRVYPIQPASHMVPECTALTPDEITLMSKEAQSYQQSRKYRVKIREARGTKAPGPQHHGIKTFLQKYVLGPGQSLLDLGCAAGAMLRQLDAMYARIGGHGNFVGVELTPGWVREAVGIFGNGSSSWNMKFFEGDVTEVRVGQTFDVIIMNDVLEHIMPKRYGCLFATLAAHSHPGTAVYMHTPTPETQLNENGQFFENVVPQHVLVTGMAFAGFQLERFAYDNETDCGTAVGRKLPGKATSNQGFRCVHQRSGMPKYSHALFRRPEDAGVLGTQKHVST